MLVIDFPEAVDTPVAKPGCDCEIVKMPPRTPSQTDIANAPDTYSVDLGTGGCVQFNTPNRAIEEFDFYTVVRTTEPDIAGFTMGEGWITNTRVSPAVAAAMDAARKAAEDASVAAAAENAAAAAYSSAAVMLAMAQAMATALGPLGLAGGDVARAQAEVDRTKAILDQASAAKRVADDRAAAAAAYAKAVTDAEAAKAAAGKTPGRADLVVLTRNAATVFVTFAKSSASVYVRVRAVNAAGAGPPSNEIIVRVR